MSGRKSGEEWREVRDLQLGWDITDFGSGRFQETGLTLLTLRNGAPGQHAIPNPTPKRCCRFSRISKPLAFSLSQNGRYYESRRRSALSAAGMGDRR
jgi:hypothetical protein